MKKQKNHRGWSRKVATFLPLLALLLMAFGQKEQNVPMSQKLFATGNFANHNDSIKQKSDNENSYHPMNVEVRLEGIMIDQENILYTLRELRNKVELYRLYNPTGSVNVRVAVQLPKDQVLATKDILSTCKNLNINYLDYDPVYSVVEQMPEFPGGIMAMREWINKNLRLLEEAKAKVSEGIVFVNFVVNSQGKVEAAKIVKGLSQERDAEALIIVNQMKTWTPAKQNGVPVNFSYTLPIVFNSK